MASAAASLVAAVAPPALIVGGGMVAPGQVELTATRVGVATILFVATLVVMLVVLTPARLETSTARRKLALGIYGAAYLALSRDSQFQLPADPGRSTAPVAGKKRIIFVRHGESAWNECFNRKFDLSFPVRLLSTLLREAALLLCLDSALLDSPLSQEGFEQAEELQRFIEGEQGEEFRKLSENAVFVSSPLRRAAATAMVGFARYFGAGRPLWLISDLQEISRNVDTLALAAPWSAPPLQPREAAVVAAAGRSAAAATGGAAWCRDAASSCMLASFNLGNKSIEDRGSRRLEAFCDWVFSPCGPAAPQPTVIVAGHSLWFRTFFQAYLPHTTYHECKHAKIVNCGVVMFELERLQPSGGRREYRIGADSVRVLYGGFEKAKAGRGAKPAAPSKRD